jgi:peptidoglycan/xylan/chitin deacetylase (PgdA/CDA1 family)
LKTFIVLYKFFARYRANRTGHFGLKTLMTIVLLSLCSTATVVAEDHAVVLIYHHVSETTPALTSVTPETFDRHLDYLQDNNFTVWPLARILSTLAAGQALPANTVAITFDDAYESVYSEAFPRLQKRNWPFTLFVSSEGVDRGYGSYLDWPQLRELADAGVELGNHSHTHAHMVRRLPNESYGQWKQRITADIKMAAFLLEQETSSSSRLFAYPYGEYSPELKKIVAALGYYGIAQQAGAIGRVSDFLALPRFPMAQAYADMERFATIVNSRPLPVSSVAVEGNAHEAYRPIKNVQLTLADGDYRAQRLACYRSNGTALETRTVADRPLTLSITITGTQDARRHKINCTAPAKSDDNSFFWYSFQWLVKHQDGSWYRE